MVFEVLDSQITNPSDSQDAARGRLHDVLAIEASQQRRIIGDIRFRRESTQRLTTGYVQYSNGTRRAAHRPPGVLYSKCRCRRVRVMPLRFDDGFANSDVIGYNASANLPERPPRW